MYTYTVQRENGSTIIVEFKNKRGGALTFCFSWFPGNCGYRIMQNMWLSKDAFKDGHEYQKLLNCVKSYLEDKSYDDRFTGVFYTISSVMDDGIVKVLKDLGFVVCLDWLFNPNSENDIQTLFFDCHNGFGRNPNSYYSEDDYDGGDYYND